LPEVSLCSAIKILEHDFLTERFQFTLCKSHTIQLHRPTFIPHSSAVLEPCPVVIQFHSHTLQFYNYTVTPLSYVFLQSYPVVIQLNSHTLQVDSYVIMRIYIFLQSNTAVNTVLQ